VKHCAAPGAVGSGRSAFRLSHPAAPPEGTALRQVAHLPWWRAPPAGAPQLRPRPGASWLSAGSVTAAGPVGRKRITRTLDNIPLGESAALSSPAKPALKVKMNRMLCHHSALEQKQRPDTKRYHVRRNSSAAPLDVGYYIGVA